MRELVMIGFTDKLRAIEVLPQLQRLRFDWCDDLKKAIAVQVERDGNVRLHHSQLLDPDSSFDDVTQWKAVLSAIIPLRHLSPERRGEASYQVRRINYEGSRWLKSESLDSDFIRNAAAILRPGNSAILAIFRDLGTAFGVLSGYSQVVLHTSIVDHFDGIEPLF